MKHESWRMGKGMRGTEGGQEWSRDFGRSKQKVIEQGTVVSRRYQSDQREWRSSEQGGKRGKRVILLQMSPTKISLLCSKMATPAIKWLPKYIPATLQSGDSTLPSVIPSPGSVLGAQPSFLCKAKSPLFTSGAAHTATKLKETLDLGVCVQTIRDTLTWVSDHS